MDRRGFLTGVVTAAAAGAITIATDEEVKAFATGDKASIVPYFSLGELLYVQKGQQYVPIGTFAALNQGTWTSDRHCTALGVVGGRMICDGDQISVEPIGIVISTS
jgi:hypothetical protein